MLKKKNNSLDELDKLNQNLIKLTKKNEKKINKMNEAMLNPKSQQKLRKTIAKLAGK